MWHLLVTWVLFAVCHAHQIAAPYQVSIRSNAIAVVGNATASDAHGQLIHICSGIIIKAEYILTTAGCTVILDKQTNISRFVNPNEIVIHAGYISLGQPSLGGHESIRRNVISVIAHSKYNSTTVENDIALLKLDRPLPLQNSTAVQWIELQQQKTAITGGNNVNENCFTNIYNSSVGPPNYPFTLISNVSHVDEKFCADRRLSTASSQFVSKRNETCWEYRFSDVRTCQLDPAALRQSGDRGTGMVCNFKLAAILAEINPPVNPQSCSQIKYTTAYYTAVGSYRDWIENEIGALYSVGLPSATGGVGAGANKATNNAGSIQPTDPNSAPASSWGDSHTPVTAPPTVKPSGKASSAAVASISVTGIVSKLILYNLFIPFAFIYGFQRC